MGLDAVVYKNARSLSPEMRTQVRLIVPETGELEFTTSKSAKQYPTDELEAATIWIGNISMVGHLREEIQQRCGDRCPILLEEFLYSGCHSGDAISLDKIPLLREELEIIERSSTRLPQNLVTFLANVRQLIDAAMQESNPIVFE